MFVTAQGSPRTRFKRAIERRSLLNAELAAREMGIVTLEEALQLVVLYAEQADPRAERAGVLGRERERGAGVPLSANPLILV